MFPKLEFLNCCICLNEVSTSYIISFQNFLVNAIEIIKLFFLKCQLKVISGKNNTRISAIQSRVFFFIDISVYNNDN